jgi:hypothetical protein
MVIEKGKSYGDSIGSPVRIFSKAGAKDGLQVRIDDKLSRIAKGSEFQGDDTLKDLVGYLALLATDNEKRPGKSSARVCAGGKPVGKKYIIKSIGVSGLCDDLDCNCALKPYPKWVKALGVSGR